VIESEPQNKFSVTMLRLNEHEMEFLILSRKSSHGKLTPEKVRMAGVVTQLITALVAISPAAPRAAIVFLGVLAAAFGVMESTMTFLWMRICWRRFKVKGELDAETSPGLRP
jgi:purine-cytosine permease-like protein